MGVALVLHESVYVSSRGLAHVHDDLAPALALHVAPSARVVLHCVFVTQAALLCAGVASGWLLLGLLASLSGLIASFPRRVPNHLAVAWFFIAAILLMR